MQGRSDASARGRAQEGSSRLTREDAALGDGPLGDGRFGVRRRTRVVGWSLSLLACAVGALVLPGSASAQELTTNSVPAAFEVSAYAADASISEAEAARRLVAQRQMPRLERLAKGALGDAYGGLWFDDKDGGKINLVVRNAAGKAQPGTQDRDKAARAASDAGFAASDVVVSGSPVGEAELVALQADLDRELEVANIGSETSVDAEPDVAEGVVRLLVPAAPTEAQRRYLEYAAAKYGTRIARGTNPGHLQEQACSSGAWCDPPLRGGIRLIYGGVGRCTSGFVVISLSDNKRYLSTAGHCISGGGIWSTHFADGSSHNIGAVHNYGSTNDFAILRIDNPSGWDPRAWIRTASDNSYQINGWSTSYVGMRVCKSGSFGGSSCGSVTGGEATRDGKAHTFRANFCTSGGDSGGPVFGSGRANGSVVGYYRSCDSVYFDAQNFSSFNVAVL